jgi:glycosyltransferase involved in cell wall biosynthesis
LKIAFVINSLDGGGAEKQLLLCAEGLARSGFECAVFWLQPRPEHLRNQRLLDLAEASGVEFCAPPRSHMPAVRQLFAIRRSLRNKQNTIVWAWGFRADILALGISVVSQRTKLVGSLRDADADRIERFGTVWRLLGRMYDAFISNSRLNVRQVAGIAPRVGQKSVVIYNAVEAEMFRVERPETGRPDHLRIVMLGNHHIYKKGYDVTIQLADLIKTAKLPFRIIIGGAPASGSGLAEEIGRRNVAGIIEIVGRIESPIEFLNAGDVYLMLSRFEGTPNTLLEAMALGLPAISTKVGDLTTCVEDGVHLRLIDTNAEAAFRAIVGLWNAWPKTQLMAKAGRDLCRTRFSQSRMVEETSRFLRAVAGPTDVRA